MVLGVYVHQQYFSHDMTMKRLLEKAHYNKFQQECNPEWGLKGTYIAVL